MKSMIAILAICGGLTAAFGQTNVIPVLNAGGQNYTNAQIIRATPAYAVVEFDGGLAKVALSNMPANLQKELHYNPLKAAQFSEEQEEQKDREKQEAADTAKRDWDYRSAHPTQIYIENRNSQNPPIYSVTINNKRCTVYLDYPPKGLDNAIITYRIGAQEATERYISGMQNGDNAAALAPSISMPKIKAFFTGRNYLGTPIWQCVYN